jgi:hypothetical protein
VRGETIGIPADANVTLNAHYSFFLDQLLPSGKSWFVKEINIETMKYNIAPKDTNDDFLSSEKRAYKKFVFKSNIVLFVPVFLIVGMLFSTYG